MEVENSSKVTRESSLNVKEALTGDRPIRFFGTKIERDFSSNGNWLIRKIYDSIVYVIGSLYASISSFVNYFRSSTAENPIEAHVTDATNTKGDSSSVNIQQVHDSENKRQIYLKIRISKLQDPRLSLNNRHLTILSKLQLLLVMKQILQ